MALGHYHSAVVYAGVPLPGVSVTVYQAGTVTLATLFSDPAGLVPLTNPFTNDAIYGTLDFFMEETFVDVLLSKAGYAFPPLVSLLVGAPYLTTVRATVNVLAGVATLTTAALIPAGAEAVHVFVTNVVAPGTSQGLTSYAVGDGTTTDRWGAGLPLTLGAQSRSERFHAPLGTVFAVPTAVVLSAEGGLWDGVGQLLVEVRYRVEVPV